MVSTSLKDLLYRISLQPTEMQIERMISVIREVTGATVASLWSVNVNSTKGSFWSASLMKRELPNEFLCDFSSENDFVHELSGSFIDDTLNYVKENGASCYSCMASECKHHLSSAKLEKIGLSKYVGIPINDVKAKKIIAIVCLYFKENVDQIEVNELIGVLGEFVPVLFERMVAFKKQSMSHNLLNLKRRMGNEKSTISFFCVVLKELLQEQCRFEGASIFAWDSYYNRFNLLSTTGIDNPNKDDEIFYYSGEGLTGNASISKNIVIYDSLSEEINNKDHIEKWREETRHRGRTMMVVPILSLSKDGDVIGIIRIINKVNKENTDIIDFFNDFDVEVYRFFADQLSLILESYLNENLQVDFITRLTHELSTPAVSISKSARMLAKHYDERNMSFVEQNMRKYLDDIYYYSEYQQWQARATMFLLKAKQKLPLSKQYKVDRTTLRKIINRSKAIVNPIARENRVSIEGIVIRGDIPSFDVFVDEIAFVTIFYNLMTNAIKYNKNGIPFYMGIYASDSPDGIVVVVEDYGMGIEERDKDKIFRVGYRSEAASRINANGFGVGLPVVKKIVTDFGGDVCVSRLSNPTSFRVTLPKQIMDINYTKTEKWTK